MVAFLKRGHQYIVKESEVMSRDTTMIARAIIMITMNNNNG